MKKIVSSLISTVLVTFSSSSAFAAWYEVTGTSTIVSSEKAARIYALEDAVYKAVDFSGADIGGLANLAPLLEDDRKQYQFIDSEVRQIVIDDQYKSGNQMVVKARIDIYPTAKACHNEQYKKTFGVAMFDIVDPQQAVMGQIYDLGEDFSSVISNQLEHRSYSFVSVGTTRYEINKRQPERIKMIAEDLGAQYLVTGQINDLTATITQGGLLSDDVINRQFAMDMSVYDGKTGHEIYQRNYREIAQWPFAKTSKVDTKSARFWTSAYGEMMQKVSRNIMLDLEAEISCKMTLPEVVASYGNKVTIDLGRVHGVQAGDRLQLWHTGSFIDQNGLPRNKVSQSDITLTVSRVYENDAEATVDQPSLANSIQIGDVMNKL
ncbi:MULTISPECIES: flagellar assembly protein FlgT [Vibrio]|uniref:Flagellar basal-body protein n=1 Tax=Vibrio mediterranei TaxID=689 RepID=A0A3G4V781_9VIBR|nr:MULTISPECIES: flagellar assembly protein FlgT [Vibrio]AYV20647.1 flagellar basal-body protein [Vibrio mediterranei]MCF4175183.1 flagellar assembly protein FlgT [Vibrio sp. McD22-P3]MCY9851029.1 flagellar assembly protein FlgT [Vibrio mediterranei]MDA0110853.1 flagellar assembly protein FlgT [Vibrio sp. La 4.2.2]NUW73268.1 flagella assembly protein FlgT [Vibrio mediterranei]